MFIEIDGQLINTDLIIDIVPANLENIDVRNSHYSKSPGVIISYVNGSTNFLHVEYKAIRKLLVQEEPKKTTRKETTSK